MGMDEVVAAHEEDGGGWGIDCSWSCFRVQSLFRRGVVELRRGIERWARCATSWEWTYSLLSSCDAEKNAATLEIELARE